MNEVTETPTPERKTTPPLGVGVQRQVIRRVCVPSYDDPETGEPGMCGAVVEEHPTMLGDVEDVLLTIRPDRDPEKLIYRTASEEIRWAV